jgi:hypothetical protein
MKMIIYVVKMKLKIIIMYESLYYINLAFDSNFKETKFLDATFSQKILEFIKKTNNLSQIIEKFTIENFITSSKIE